MSKKGFFVAALGAAALAAGGVTAAFAGEVKGPPGTGAVTGGNTNTTAAPANAHSICAFSGLNDYDPEEGHVSFHVQAYGIDVAGKGDPADPHEFNPGDACRGNGG
jgi:ABC-type oligopeptide transport system substrate-binding subunit